MNPATPGATLDVRQCLSEPIAQIKDAARYLDAAVSAHLQDKRAIAEELFRLADMQEIRRWTKSICANSEIHVRHRSTEPTLAKELRTKERMPSQADKARVISATGTTAGSAACQSFEPKHASAYTKPTLTLSAGATRKCSSTPPSRQCGRSMIMLSRTRAAERTTSRIWFSLARLATSDGPAIRSKRLPSPIQGFGYRCSPSGTA